MMSSRSPMIAGRRRARTRHARRKEYRAQQALKGGDRDENDDEDDEDDDDWVDDNEAIYEEDRATIEEVIRQSLLDHKGRDASDPILLDDADSVEAEKKSRKYRKRVSRYCRASLLYCSILLRCRVQGRSLGKRRRS